MSRLVRGVLGLSFLTLILAFPTAAIADMDCNQCDLYYGACGTSCYICHIYEQDGCAQWEYTTCGESGRPCIQEGCTPNWQETARENRGTYGEAGFFCWWGSGCTYWCDHHRVDWVTITDANQCNSNPSFYSTSYCHDYIDATKGPSSAYQDCCSGFGPGGLDPTFTCNHYHSCW